MATVYVATISCLGGLGTKSTSDLNMVIQGPEVFYRSNSDNRSLILLPSSRLVIFEEPKGPSILKGMLYYFLCVNDSVFRYFGIIHLINQVTELVTVFLHFLSTNLFRCVGGKGGFDYRSHYGTPLSQLMSCQ